MVTEFCARQSNQGVVVFSPITHSHELAKFGTPTKWEFWRQIDIEFIRRSGFLVVLMLEGWKNSVGVQAEIKLAKEFDIPIMYLKYEDNITQQFSPDEQKELFFNSTL
jgi:hypothetical protein